MNYTPTTWAHYSPLALLLLLTLLCYAPGLAGPFLFDDGPALTGNPFLRIDGHALDDWRTASLSSNSGPLRRPLAMFSFTANHVAAGGIHALPVKLVNVLLHLGCGVLVAPEDQPIQCVPSESNDPCPPGMHCVAAGRCAFARTMPEDATPDALLPDAIVSDRIIDIEPLPDGSMDAPMDATEDAPVDVIPDADVAPRLCMTDSDCGEFMLCDRPSGVCFTPAGRPNGEPCSAHSECGSNHCAPTSSFRGQEIPGSTETGCRFANCT